LSYEVSQKPMYELFGTPEADKYHKLYEAGHNFWNKREWIRDTLAFLDK
jgi:hypothetical protein